MVAGEYQGEWTHTRRVSRVAHRGGQMQALHLFTRCPAQCNHQDHGLQPAALMRYFRASRHDHLIEDTELTGC